MADPRIDEVLRFWFGAPGEPPEARMKRWFVRDPAFDDEILTRFTALIEDAGRGRLDSWGSTPRGALALVVVLDQLSRNAFRDTPRAFAQDERALAVARGAISEGRERQLDWTERYILRMPFMHGEDRAVQRESVATFTALHAEATAAGAPADVLAALANAVDYAGQHARIVERFGRYPHRNELLGRPSTPEEEAFLLEPGSRF